LGLTHQRGANDVDSLGGGGGGNGRGNAGGAFWVTSLHAHSGSGDDEPRRCVSNRFELF
jgi:hypothetical protein